MRVLVTGKASTFDRVLKRINTEAIARDAAKEIQAYFLHNVDQGVDADEKPFAPHSPNYNRGKGWPKPYKFLNWTGKMLASFETVSTKTALGHRATISNTTPYFKYIQRGTEKMPQRSVFGEGKNFTDILERVARKHVQEALQ